MSEFNDGGLAERGGGGLANPGGPNTAGGGGGQANRSGIGLGVNSGAGWANNPYSNNRNPGGIMASGTVNKNYVGPSFRPTVRRNPVTGQPIVNAPIEYDPYGQPILPTGYPTGYNLYPAGSFNDFWDDPQFQYPDEPFNDFGSGYTPSPYSPGPHPFSGVGNKPYNDRISPEASMSTNGLAAISGFAADPNAPSGIMTMMGGQPGQGMPGRRPGPMVNPGPIGPGGQPGTDPRSAQLLAFHQAMQDWKGQRPQDRNDMAAWEAWRNSRPDRPNFGRPRPRMSRPPRVAEQRPAPRPRGFQIGGDLALRHMYNR